ncbi:MAG: DnaJ domain-containing protein [Gammaproteobacteria bacterium]|nr:DnaJ domain-containing protein [Gammaproteobacteria bacterium]
MDNPLKLALLHELKKSNNPLKIHELFSIVKSLLDNEDDNGLSSEELIFRQNFVIMNALYQLQNELFVEQLYLSITTMSIYIYPVKSDDLQQHMETDRQSTLKAYYLDWKNYHETTENEIKALFDSFWKRFVNEDKHLSALENLNLTIPTDWDTIKKQYRHEANLSHPDKGGDAVKFIEVREAYEVLKQVYCS